MTEKRKNVAGLERLKVQLKYLLYSGLSEKNKSKMRTEPDSNSKRKAGALLGNKPFTESLNW